MRLPTSAVVIAFLLGFACLLPAQDNPAPPKAESKFSKVVKIEFPKDGYTFTLAEAAKGIKIEYKIVVEEDMKVIALLNPPSYREPAGPSGLHTSEQLSGKDQLYCLRDCGLRGAPEKVVHTLKKATYTHAFEWDGLNWTGPSDSNRPKGKPFPAGTYDLTVTMSGLLVTDKEKVPYKLTGTAKLVLK
ncbi:MAG: hypothetical protein C0467_25265 [Planctomycetaceae bacterium]|nr:hypothetical protein [Planctomycetaceae bacterium]